MKRGFTLLETVVVLAVIAILLSLVLAGVLAARDSARRMGCQNNLRQIGVGVLAYESASKFLPTGWNEMTFSIHVQILPHVGENLNYNRFDHGDWAYFPKNRDIAQAMKIPVYWCPADQSTLSVDYAFNRGSRLSEPFDSPNPCIQFKEHRMKLAGLRSTSSVASFSEIDHRPNGGIRLAPEEWRSDEQYSDGCKREGERLPFLHWGSTDWSYCFESSYRHILGPNSPSCRRGSRLETALLSAASNHHGGVNVLFFDGHVVFVSDSIDSVTWRDLGSNSQ